MFRGPHSATTRHIPAVRRCAPRLLLVWLQLVVVAGAFAQTPATSSGSLDERYLEGLRSRRLFDLAAGYCRERLSAATVAGDERMLLTGQLLLTLGQKALHLPAGQRSTTWQEAHQVADQYLAAHADHPRSSLIRMQDALVFLAEGELSRQEAEAARGRPQEQFQAALDVLRTAVQRLEQLDQQLEQALPRAPRQATATSMSADELFALRNHVRLELARAFRNRGLCYPDGDDRLAAVAQALDPLRDALSQLPADDPLAWRARLEQAICYRMLGSQVEAQRALATLTPEQIPAELVGAIQAETIRILLATNQLAQAQKLAAQPLAPGLAGAADAGLARLEVFVALWQQAAQQQNEAEAANWRAQAVDWTRQIEETFGGYWGRRAEQLLLRSAESGSGAADVEILRRQADDLYLQSKLDEARTAYDQAAEAAATAGLADEEFLSRFRAALVAQRQALLDEARIRFQRLAMSLSQHPQAAAAHLEAVKIAIEQARQDPQLLSLYEQLLDEHLTHWSSGATRDLALLWMATLKRHQREWPDALGYYRQIALQSAQAPEALEGAEAACRGQLIESANTGGLDMKRLDECLTFFGGVAADAPDLAPDATMAAVRLLLQFAPHRAAEASRLLENRLAQAEANAIWKEQAESLLVVALALQTARRDEALQRLAALQNASPQLALEMLQRLSALHASAPPALRSTLGQLQLQLIDRVESTADAAMRVQLERIRGAALAAVGRREEALQALSQLVADYPRDGRLQIEYAQLLEQGGDERSWQAALDQWRIVAQHVRPRTDDWYLAKYSLAQAQCELGQRQDAAKLLRYVLLVAPPPDDSVWKKSFEQLLSRCEP
jgi:exonuclease VII small subunit